MQAGGVFDVDVEGGHKRMVQFGTNVVVFKKLWF